MRVVGFDCSGTEFRFVVVEGSQSKPVLVTHETRKAPADCDRPQQLQWLRREVQAILDKHQPEAAAYKAAQSMPGRAVGQERCQFEGVLMEAALSHSSNLPMQGLITIQLKKKLGLSKVKGTDCLQSLIDTTFSGLPKKYSDAALVGLSQLGNS